MIEVPDKARQTQLAIQDVQIQFRSWYILESETCLSIKWDKIVSAGKQRQQICKLRVTRRTRLGLEVGAQMQVREGAVTQRGVRIAGKRREGLPWQGSATLGRKAGTSGPGISPSWEGGGAYGLLYY